MSVKNSRKRSGFLIYSYSILKTMHLLQLKGDAKFQNYCRYVNGLPFVNQKGGGGGGLPFQSKGVYKRVRVRDWPSLMKTFKYPPR